jgi:hypothetical protein
MELGDLAVGDGAGELHAEDGFKEGLDAMGGAEGDVELDAVEGGAAPGGFAGAGAGLIHMSDLVGFVVDAEVAPFEGEGTALPAVFLEAVTLFFRTSRVVRGSVARFEFGH